tara:strand:- start:2 stop:676 length:675 start_codon:yes stop_codon:yes gene_type:complete
MTTFQPQVHALFPTPVGSYSGFAGQDALQEKLLTLLTCDQARINTQDPQLRHWFDVSGGGVLEIEEPLLQDLKTWILDCALFFVQQVQGIQCDGMQVISSWCNCADVGASQAPHSHENSWISGTYYVCFEEGHSPIRFWRPGALAQPNRPYFSMAARDQLTSFSADEIQIAPAPGTLLLWPSHLLHGHSGNARNGRLSLSMNLLPQRLIGSSYSLDLSPLASNV